MKKLFILLILMTGTIFAAEPLVKDHAYIVSSINKSETVEEGESFSLVPQVVVATGNEKYIGSVSTFTGCYGGKRYEAGTEVGNCLISVIDSLNSDSRTDALSAYQGKVLNERIEKIEEDSIVNLFHPETFNWDTKDLNGVTVTNNHDGTFTLNGVADNNQSYTDNTYKALWIGSIYMEAGKEYKFLGCPDVEGAFIGGDSVGVSFYNGGTVTKEQSGWYGVAIAIYKGANLNNAVFKPMVTTSLNATYEDFVPYDNNTEIINMNVPQMKTVFSANPAVTINYQFIMSYQGKEFGTITFTTTKDFERWNFLITGLDSSDLYDNQRGFCDTTGTYGFERHRGGGIQTAGYLPAGTYTIIF